MQVSKKIERTLFPDRRKDDLSGHGYRQLIGSVGLLMPLLLWLIAGLRPIQDRPWGLLGSVSAYYYTGAVSVFAGLLIALALFLLSYKGYENQYYLRDRVAAIIAGLAAVLIALFPTSAPEGIPALPWWTKPTGTIHYSSAVVLFGSFIFFSLFQFPKSNVGNGEALPPDKKVRNWIYYSCGAAMSACMVWVIYALSIGAPIFWPEALALEFFAISWLVKGRVEVTAAEAGKQTIRYVRHPRQLVLDVKGAVHELQDVGKSAAGSETKG